MFSNNRGNLDYVGFCRQPTYFEHWITYIYVNQMINNIIITYLLLFSLLIKKAYPSSKSISINYINHHTGMIESFNFYKGIATISNACYLRNTIYSYNNNSNISIPHIYHSVLNETIKINNESLFIIPNNTHGTKNIFHCVETLSPIIDIVLYPRLYENVCDEWLI